MVGVIPGFLSTTLIILIMSLNRRFIYSCLLGLLPLISGGCFTGIESTKKIRLSREEKKAVAPTPEDMYLTSVRPSCDSEWIEGKEFIVVGDRGSVMFEPRKIVSGRFQLMAGDTLRFIDSRRVTLPDGNKITSLRFRRGDDEFSYIPDGRGSAAGIYSDAIPGVVDPAMLAAVDSLMRGRTFWTRNSLWEDKEGDRCQGRKFEKVIIENVGPGSMIFPVRVTFRDNDGKLSSMLMNFGNSGKDSRSFANLFQLSDPRRDYPNVSDAVWENIMKGEVSEGMTKEECRLAKGNPVDVNTGHDYQHSLLIWNYPDGTMLYFIDGILRGINTIPSE